jgi:uncharacterized membrane protein
MDSSILLGLLLSFLPGAEARYGIIPIAYSAFGDKLVFWPLFFLTFILNILVVPVVFLFLEYLHHHLIPWKPYRRTIGAFVDRQKSKAEGVQERMYNLGYVALLFFVAVPFTGTGAYTATIIAWTLGLSKRKSFLAISIGVFIAMIIGLLGVLSVLSVLA